VPIEMGASSIGNSRIDAAEIPVPGFRFENICLSAGPQSYHRSCLMPSSDRAKTPVRHSPWGAIYLQVLQR
jgi:hypothetical protein